MAGRTEEVVDDSQASGGVASRQQSTVVNPFLDEKNTYVSRWVMKQSLAAVKICRGEPVEGDVLRKRCLVIGESLFVNGLADETNWIQPEHGFESKESSKLLPVNGSLEQTQHIPSPKKLHSMAPIAVLACPARASP